MSLQSGVCRLTEYPVGTYRPAAITRLKSGELARLKGRASPTVQSASAFKRLEEFETLDAFAMVSTPPWCAAVHYEDERREPFSARDDAGFRNFKVRSNSTNSIGLH